MKMSYYTEGCKCIYDLFNLHCANLFLNLSPLLHNLNIYVSVHLVVLNFTFYLCIEL